ncbi:MAG: hypothetical protein P1V35_16265, partial [Planctomycetota bacterium]|nr:hypothetical protein [Planctomycetota bacterium]
MKQTLKADPSISSEAHFGMSMDTDGDTIVLMSASFAEGAVHVFERNSHLQTWERVARFVPPATSISGKFDGGVAVHGDRILVGAPDEDDGVVYVIDRDPISGVWSFGQTIVRPPGSTINYKYFGASVDLEMDRMVVAELAAQNTAGRVHVLEFSNGADQWIIADVLFPPHSYGFYFGRDLELQGDRLIAGAPNINIFGSMALGGAFIWERDPVLNTWQLSLEVVNFLGDVGDFVGQSVSLDGDNAYIAVPGDGVPQGSSSGSIWHFVYNPGTSTWVEQQPITPGPIPGAPGWSGLGSVGIGVEEGTMVVSMWDPQFPATLF